jgi:hypothetical protein
MAILDGMSSSTEKPKTVDASTSQQAFINDPKQLFQTLKNDYSKISSGQENLNLPVLQLYAEHGGDPTDREAASLALKYFGDLSNISAQGADIHHAPGTSISRDDLNFALDMNDGKTFGHTISRALSDTGQFGGFGVVLGGMGVGMVGGFSRIAVPIIQESLEADYLSLPATIGLAGLGLGGVLTATGAIAALSLSYNIYEESREVANVSQQDRAMFKTWIPAT